MAAGIDLNETLSHAHTLATAAAAAARASALLSVVVQALKP
jgi:purine-nucleoside phosphorylase